MLNIVICDDEKIQRDGLKKTITIELELAALEYQIYEFDCGEALCDLIQEREYDIIFLDIEMKSLNGIKTAEIIRRYNKHAVVLFVTAYPDFVFQGYEVHALNYILKPYKKEKIVHVLADALEYLEINRDKYLLIELKEGTHKLNLSDTLYFSSNKRKISAFTKAGVKEFYGRLDDLEKEVPSFFVRIHQSYLVNIRNVSAVENNFAIVAGVGKLPVSRNRNQNLLVQFAKKLLD